MSFDMDPSLMQDFLTESAELIDQLDADLVRLETAAADDVAGVRDLCNSCFRALHTIKGAASFLALTPVTTFAHAAEDALNRLRKGEVEVNSTVMDALLQSADVVRRQIAALSAGEAAPDAPATLIEQLHDIATAGSGGAIDAPVADAAAEAVATAPADIDGAQDPREADAGVLTLPPQKLDLLDFMVADLQDASRQLDDVVPQLGNDATRVDAAHHLHEIADSMVKTAEFFELSDLSLAVNALMELSPRLAETPASLIPEIAVRILALKRLIDEQAAALMDRRVLHWPLGTLLDRLAQLGEGVGLDGDVAGRHGGDVEALLALDGVTADTPAVIEPESEPAPSTATPTPAMPAPPADDQGKTPPQAQPQPQAPTQASASPVAEQTIRVEVSRLESLLNLVGQLVLNKNRVLALTRSVRDLDVPQETSEQFAAAAGDYDRLMSELQMGVMRTRMQPLAKLFDRYPRVIRDVARLTDKKINLEIVGKDTEVDKSVLEQLADPLVHILRNSADHGVEKPDARLAAGKSDTGTIRLTAEHRGSHVRVAIEDDGKGLDREVIGNKAIERGLTTPEQLAQLSDQDVFRFIFEAGFSTAEKVSDLSGRGVGMDVVRTNIQKLNGTINIASTKGRGTTIEVLIPLTVAIMPAMVVGVGRHLYCVPLQSVVEIVRPEPNEVYTVAGHPVMKLRDSVLPLVNLQRRLNEAEVPGGGRFAVVVGAGGQRTGLVVDKLVGQQEIVIKPLDDAYTHGGPFSGATIREDGEVSLILDVVQLLRASAPGASSPPMRKAA
jgi:two-component system chemotaxis sensor kinase CheA